MEYWQVIASILAVLSSVATAGWIGFCMGFKSSRYKSGYTDGYNQCLTDTYRELYNDRKEWEFKQERLN